MISFVILFLSSYIVFALTTTGRGVETHYCLVVLKSMGSPCEKNLNGRATKTQRLFTHLHTVAYESFSVLQWSSLDNLKRV